MPKHKRVYNLTADELRHIADVMDNVCIDSTRLEYSNITAGQLIKDIYNGKAVIKLKTRRTYL